MRALGALWDRIQGDVLGRSCVRCERTGGYVCAKCAEAPLVISSLEERPVLALGAHENQLAELVHRLKYGDETHLAAPLGRALGAGYRSLFARGAYPKACLVPVPLHPERLAERGYNQSALLAAALGRDAKLPVAHHLLTRNVRTRAQASLGEAERAANLKSAFSAAPSGPSPTPIWLIDDVCTTGSTLLACAEALVEKGHQVRGAVSVAISKQRYARLGATSGLFHFQESELTTCPAARRL